MNDPAKVTQLFPKQPSTEPELKIKQPMLSPSKQSARAHSFQEASLWFIRNHADGSWSVLANGEAANDPGFSQSEDD